IHFAMINFLEEFWCGRPGVAESPPVKNTKNNNIFNCKYFPNICITIYHPLFGKNTKSSEI
ncbi:hypothetical protein, partial [Parabacteroides goldsteinii]|uniref:hypothetical protein n=1 Tax=Parabacteroides goldsteinii TaxID=328812 RepID=UPI0026717EAC